MTLHPTSYIPNSKSGFTFIELLVYLGISSIILVATIQFSWDVIYGQVKSRVQREVNQNLRLVSERIIFEIRNSTSINELTSTSISLNTADPARNPTVIDLNNNQIRIGYGATGDCPASSPCALTSNLINVSTLNFTDLSVGNSGHIKVLFTLEHINPNNRKEWEKSQTYQTSVELRN